MAKQSAFAAPIVVVSMVSQFMAPPAAADAASHKVPVTVGNFVRAESDTYFAAKVKAAGLGILQHTRKLTSVDKQGVVRMNLDTLYSSGVFDLDAGPVTITLPDTAKRFMSMQVISEDQYTIEVAYAPGTHTYDKAKIGSRYVYILIRTLVDPQTPGDLQAVNKLQDEISVAQAGKGSFQVPDWDPTSQAKVRNALLLLGSLGGSEMGTMFGTKSEVNPVAYLVGAAAGWGGNPSDAAVYKPVFPKADDGKTVHKLTVKDVPVDGFWSISVYNAKGYFEKNDLNAYAINNYTAKPDADGAITVQFGGCGTKTPNCLPIMKGWNYTVRLYRPRQEILNGTWIFPEAQPVSK